MAVLANCPLQDLTGEVLLCHILDLIEVARGAIIRATVQFGLCRRMDEILLRIRIGPIDHLARVDLERRRRVWCLLDLLDQMAGGAPDAFDLRFT